MTLRAANLTFYRDDHCIFRDVSFTLAAGMVLHVQGANGAGKTTLLRALCGLLPTDNGGIFWREQAVENCLADYRRDMLYQGHAPGVKDLLSPRENLQTALALVGQQPRVAFADALTHFGLRGYEDVPCHRLSAGQRRRVGLARLLLSPAPLWILDEPFAALDQEGISLLESTLQEHIADGGLVVVTTHQHENLPLDNLQSLVMSKPL